jgi:hypothetical protein
LRRGNSRNSFQKRFPRASDHCASWHGEWRRVRPARRHPVEHTATIENSKNSVEVNSFCSRLAARRVIPYRLVLQSYKPHHSCALGFRSDLCSTAVNKKFDTRDETGVIRSQEQPHLCNFIGFPHASHRDRGHNPRNLWRLPTQHRRINWTRTHNVGADAPVLRSVVQVRTKERMAALLAAYTPKAGIPLTLATEPLRMAARREPWATGEPPFVPRTRGI